MGWLSGWDKRIKLTIDQTKVDTANQSNFPVLVHLSTTSGITSADVSCVFDELTTDANRKKIAVTTSDGTTECYVEIERWDDASEKAWLWVKVLSVAYNLDTELYLYYDKDHADNTTYIGDIGSTPAQNVWDSNFVGVWHMSQDPTGGSGCIKDSTSNTNHGTPGGSMTSGDLVDGKTGKALDFDGSDDCISLPDNSDFKPDYVSVEALCKTDTGNADWVRIFDRSYFSASNIGYALVISDVGKARFHPILTGNEYHDADSTDVIEGDGKWHYLVGSYEDNHTKFYDNGNLTEDEVGGSGKVVIHQESQVPQIGNGVYDSAYKGIIDELRISNIARSASWIKATYYSNWDSLITFGSEEIVVTNHFDGKVRIKDSVTNHFDGKVRIKDSVTNHFDGKVDINTAINHFDGKARIKDFVTNLFDGKARIKDSVTNLFDGKARIKDFVTNLFDGKAKIKDSVTNLFDGKAKIKDSVTNLFDGKAKIKVFATNLLDGKTWIVYTGQINDYCPTPTCEMSAVFRYARIEASPPIPTASFRIGRIIEGYCPVPGFTCTAYSGRNPSIIASSPCPTCSMRIGLSFSGDVSVPICNMVADTHHLTTIYGRVPVPLFTCIGDTENITIISGTVPIPTGLFEVTVGNVASIFGRSPCPYCTMVALTGQVISLYGRVPVPGALVRFYASLANDTIILTGTVPTPIMTSSVDCFTSSILRHVRGKIR